MARGLSLTKLHQSPGFEHVAYVGMGGSLPLELSIGVTVGLHGSRRGLGLFYSNRFEDVAHLTLTF